MSQFTGKISGAFQKLAFGHHAGADTTIDQEQQKVVTTLAFGTSAVISCKGCSVVFEENRKPGTLTQNRANIRLMPEVEPRRIQNPAAFTVQRAIVPLTISAAPFIARIIESSLLEINPGIIEAAQAMGASPMQIITKVLLPESLHSIVLGVTLAIISLIGYSAMAGTLGGGGLGDLAIRYGYQRFQMDVMLATVVVLIVMVQAMQSLGDYASKKLNKNKL